MSIYLTQEEWDTLSISISNIFGMEYIQTPYEKPIIEEFDFIPVFITDEMRVSISETVKRDWERQYNERKELVRVLREELYKV